MRLISVFGDDLNPGEDSGVRSSRIVMENKIANDENDGNGNHCCPYLCDGPRRDSQMPQLFRYESCFTDGKPCATRLGPTHADLANGLGRIIF